MKPRFLIAAAALLITSSAFGAGCVNRYIAQKDGSKVVITVLTGKLTYAEAYGLAQAVNAKTVAPPEWVEEKGKMIAKVLGDLKVIRPMPIACDEKTSGVVMSMTFLATRAPSGKMFLKIDDKTTIALEEQTQQ